MRLSTNAEAASTWIVKKLGDKLKDNPGITIDAMQSLLHKKFGIDPHKMQVYRAKSKIVSELEGNHGDSNSMLRMYANEILHTNLGSIAKIECERTEVCKCTSKAMYLFCNSFASPHILSSFLETCSAMSTFLLLGA